MHHPPGYSKVWPGRVRFDVWKTLIYHGGDLIKFGVGSLTLAMELFTIDEILYLIEKGAKVDLCVDELICIAIKKHDIISAKFLVEQYNYDAKMCEKKMLLNAIQGGKSCVPILEFLSKLG